MNNGNLYTDAPALHKNLLVGSLQLLFWLFFHPAAWRNHVKRIDAALRPNFSLAELNYSQWRNLAFWRLLLMVYLLWPLLVAFMVGVVLWQLGMPAESVTLGILIGVAIGIVASLAASVAGSLPVGVAVGIAVSLVVGLGWSLAFGTEGALVARVADLSFELIVSTGVGLAGGLAGGLAFGVAAGVAGVTANLEPAHSLTRQVSGIIIGTLIGIAAGLLVGEVTGRLATGLAVGVPFGLAIGLRTARWRRGLIAGLLVSLIAMLSGGLPETGFAGGLVGAIFLALLMTSLFALPYVLAERMVGAWAGALAGCLGSGGGLFLFVSTGQSFWEIILFSLVGVLLGLTLAWWRPVILYPFMTAWNLLLMRLDERPWRAAAQEGSLLRWHSAFWDELQPLPLMGLDSHLLLVMAQYPAEGERAVDYLMNSRQRWAAQAAQIELDARRLEQRRGIAAIGSAHLGLSAGELAGPVSALLRSLSRISRDVDAALRQESVYNRRLALSAVEDRLDGLLRELTRSNEPYAARFRPIAARWRQVVAAHGQKLAEEAEMRQEIDSPYIIGVPLTNQQEIFVGRTDISARIEQLLLDRRRPPLFLYGQRRVGKTSLLNNLGRLLPSTIVPLFVDLQGPASRAKDEIGFFYNVARGMIKSARQQRGVELPALARASLEEDPFTCFDEWLDEVEATLANNVALLMLDEFEVLDKALVKGRFDEEAILGMLRHLIQHRTRFKVLLSGSHTLDEFQRWASYLINVQVIHIGYLSTDEARQLVEAPVADFALRYDPQASQRVIALTRGHPFLVQLLCAEIVALKNEQEPAVRRLARLQDVETAVPHALRHGSFFFADIRQNQVDQAGLDVLHFLAAQGEETAVSHADLAAALSGADLERTLAHLQQRELVERTAGGYRFQVELVRRWFAKPVFSHPSGSLH